MNQRNNSGSRFSQSIPVIKVTTRNQSNNNSSGKTNNNNNNNNNNNTNSFFSRFNRNQNNNLKSKTSDNRSNIQNKNITPIDHQNYFSSTQKLSPSRQSWQSLSQVVHDLVTKCFVNLTNPQLLTEFLHAESQLSDFFRLSKMVFNNARPTRGGNPRRTAQTSHQPRPPPHEPPKRSSSARRKIRSDSKNETVTTNTTNQQNNENSTEINKKTENETTDEVTTHKPVGSDLRPTHAVSKLGLQFIEQWDSFLGEFNSVSMHGVQPLNSLISSRILFISHFMRKTVSSFFVSPQANVPIGAMNRAYSVSLSIARKAKKLHSHYEDFNYGIFQLERSILTFFDRTVPHPMAYSNALQNARKDLFIQLSEVEQMIYGVSIFDHMVNSIRLHMEDVNEKFNGLFTDLNLPYRIVASYDDEENGNNGDDRKAVSDVKDEAEEEEEEEFEEDMDDGKQQQPDFDYFDQLKKKQDKETEEHLDKIRSNIEKIEEALALGQKMIRKKKK